MAKYAAKRKKRRIGNRLTRKLLQILLFTVILFVFTVFGVSARYVYHGRGGEAVVVASEFYFTSDYLAPEGPEYVLNPGTTSVTFNLRNYDGLKVSGLDVNYTIEKDDTEIKSGTIPAGTASDVEVTLNNLTPGPYQVSATGSNGYMRVLSATFTVRADSDGIYKHTEDCGDYVLLTIWTQGVTNNASFSVPSGLIPDYTDPKLTGKSAGSTISVTLGANQSVSYRFFKSGGYASGPIAVTAGGEPVNETALN